MNPRENNQQPNGGGSSDGIQPVANPGQPTAAPAPTSQANNEAANVGAAPQALQDTQAPNPPTVSGPAQATSEPGNDVNSSAQTGNIVSGSLANNEGGAGKKKFLAGGIVAGVVLLSLGAVFGYYLPNQPQNVWRTGLERTGKTMDEMVIKATDIEQLNAIKNTEITGSIEATGDDFSYSGNFNTRFNKTDSTADFDSKLESPDGEPMELAVNVLATLPDGSDYPDMYMKLTGLRLLGVDAFYPGAGEYDGKWVHMSSKYLESLAPAKYKNGSRDNLTQEDAAELARIISSTTREYIFSADTEKAVLEQKEFVGTEELDGIKANHYVVGINKDNAKKYCETITDRFMSADAYKRLPGVDADSIEKDKEAEIKNCKEDIDKELEDNDSFDMWVDKKYKLIHKVRFTHEDDAGKYMEIGQTYTGGDVMPLFFTYHDEKEGYDGKLTLDVNTKTSTTSSTITFNSSGDFKLDLTGSLEFKPYEGEIKIQKPSESIPVEEILGQLGRGYSDYTSTSVSATQATEL